MPWSNQVIGQLAALLVRTGGASQVDAWLEKLGPGTAPGAASGLVIFHALCGELGVADIKEPDAITQAVQVTPLPADDQRGSRGAGIRFSKGVQ